MRRVRETRIVGRRGLPTAGKIILFLSREDYSLFSLGVSMWLRKNSIDFSSGLQACKDVPLGVEVETRKTVEIPSGRKSVVQAGGNSR